MNISQATISEIKKLSVSEKILIVEEIWDDIAGCGEYPELTENQREALNERVDSYHANPQQGRTLDEIKRGFWQSITW